MFKIIQEDNSEKNPKVPLLLEEKALPAYSPPSNNLLPKENYSIQISHNEAEVLPIIQITKRILFHGFFTAASFTFSMGIGIVGIWGPYVAKSNSPTDVLAGLSLTTSMKQLVTGTTITGLYAISILGSVAYGEYKAGNNSQRAHIGVIYRNGVLWGLLISTPMSLVYYFSKSILMAMGQPEGAAAMAQTYLRPYAPALPLAALRICGQEMLLAFGQSKIATAAALPSLFVAMGVSAGLIYGPLDMGLEGLAYGFLIEAGLSALMMNGYILMGRGDFKNIPLLRSFISNYQNFLKDMSVFSKIGLVVSVQVVGFFLADSLVGVLAGQFGEDSLAAQNFVTQFSFLLVIPIIAFGQSIMQEVGRLRGKREFENASRYARWGLLIQQSIILVPCSIVMAYPNIVMDIFSQSTPSNVTKTAGTLLRMAAVGRFFDSALFNVIQVLRQAEDKNLPTIIALLETLGLGIASAYVLGNFTELEVYGVNIGYFGGLVLSCTSLLRRWWVNTRSERFEDAQDVKEGLVMARPSVLQVGYNYAASWVNSCCSFFHTKAVNVETIEETPSHLEVKKYIN